MTCAENFSVRHTQPLYTAEPKQNLFGAISLLLKTEVTVLVVICRLTDQNALPAIAVLDIKNKKK